MRLPQHYAYFSYPSLEDWDYSSRSYKTEVLRNTAKNTVI